LSDMITLCTNVGFPIAVAVYVLVRMESRFHAVTESNNKLAEAINGLIQVVGYCNQSARSRHHIAYKNIRRDACDTISKGL